MFKIDDKRKADINLKNLAKSNNELNNDLETLDNENYKMKNLNDEIRNRIRKDEERLDIQKEELVNLEKSRKVNELQIEELNESIEEISEKSKSLNLKINEKKNKLAGKEKELLKLKNSNKSQLNSLDKLKSEHTQSFKTRVSLGWTLTSFFRNDDRII